MIIAESFFDSDTFTLARNLTGFFVVVFWLATAFWVFKDARRRIDDPWLVAMAALLGLVPPFIGPIVYLFLRPPDSIEERRDRELENRALEDAPGRARPALPGLPRRGGRIVPRLPRLHDAPQAGVQLVRLSARADLAGVPVLRHSRPAGSRHRRRGAAAAARAPHELTPPDRSPAERRAVATTLSRLWLPKPHSFSSSRTASVAHSAARSSPASSVAATSCAAPACSRSLARSRSSTTPSTRESRSSASSSRSSPPAPCSRSPSAVRTRSSASAG